MTGKKTTTVSTAARPACKYPGCGQPAAPADNASPVTMAKMTGAELLRSLRAEADRISARHRPARPGRHPGRPHRRRGRSVPRRD